jgi:hypothetical protein
VYPCYGDGRYRTILFHY